MAVPQTIVRSLKFDGIVRRSWTCELIGQNENELTFVGIFDRDVEHDHLGLIRKGTFSYEYYWLDRWYNVFRFHEPDGRFRNYYCNLTLPPTFDGNNLDYVDLDIDLLVWPDMSIEILDSAEFDENSEKFVYPADLIRKVELSIDELTGLIERREFPFDQHRQGRP